MFFLLVTTITNVHNLTMKTFTCPISRSLHETWIICVLAMVSGILLAFHVTLVSIVASRLLSTTHKQKGRKMSLVYPKI